MKCLTTWQINLKVIFSGITWLFQNFESLNNLIMIICLYELRSKSKLESSWRNASRFQFWWCENNIETSTLFQNDYPSFASSSKISPHPSVTLLHTIESWLETHFVLFLAKIIEYTVFQLSLSHWFVFIETSRQYLKNLGGLMERSASQPRSFMLSTINFFKLMIEVFVK